MTSPTTTFFEGLSVQRSAPLLRKVQGRIRFDVVDDDQTEYWLLDIDRGDLRISQAAGEADCGVRAERAVLDEIVSGNRNAMAEMLRGGLAVEGDLELLVLVQRLFPPRTEDSS